MGANLIDLKSKFDMVYIDEKSLDSELAKRAIKIFSADVIQIVRDKPLSDIRGTLSSAEFSKSKRRLWITPYQGLFFKRCPGSRPGLMCCNYYVLNWGSQCDMNCSYCYLQSFVNSPVTTLYSNIEDALKELQSFDSATREQKIRIGTGETVDSLSMDDLTLHSRRMIEFFKDYPNWTLEFKTKSAVVDNFLDCEHVGNVVVSWSINPDYVIRKEEHGTAIFFERMNAAEKCVRNGFQVAFHIDPMIHHEGWQKNYAELVDTIASKFTPEQVNVISIGSLRFQPEQRHMMKERFGMDSLVNSGEMFKSKDGKLRYDAELRSEMFSFVLNRFKSHSSDWKIFLCMETPETWVGIGKKNPHKDPGIKDLFQPVRPTFSGPESPEKVGRT